MSERADKAIFVLEGTRDVHHLSRGEAYLLQQRLISRTTPAEDDVFDDLHHTVASDAYYQLWMCGVEHLTQDHEGYVYWKGINVEHYSHRDPHAKRRAAEGLAERCQTLESKGFPVTGRNVLDDALLEAPSGTPWLQAMQRIYSSFQIGIHAAVIFHGKRTKPRDFAEGVVLGSGGLSDRYKDVLEAFYVLQHLHRQAEARGEQPPAELFDTKTYQGTVALFERAGLTPEGLQHALAA